MSRPFLNFIDGPASQGKKSYINVIFLLFHLIMKVNCPNRKNEKQNFIVYYSDDS